MRLPRHKWTRLALLLIGVLAALALTACNSVANTPQSVINPFSPAAARDGQSLLSSSFGLRSLFLFLSRACWSFLSFAINAARRTNSPEQYHGNTRLEITWTIIPALILAGRLCADDPRHGIRRSDEPARARHARSPSQDINGGGKFNTTTANNTASELHMPTGQVMNIALDLGQCHPQFLGSRASWARPIPFRAR